MYWKSYKLPLIIFVVDPLKITMLIYLTVKKRTSITKRIRRCWQNWSIPETSFVLKQDKNFFSNIVVQKVFVLLLYKRGFRYGSSFHKISERSYRWLSLPLTKIINLSVELSLFPGECQIAKLKPLFKKDSKLIPKTTDLLCFCLYMVAEMLQK